MTGLPSTSPPGAAFGVALGTIWSADGEAAVARAVADAALLLPGVAAAKVHTVHRDRTVAGPVTAGTWTDQPTRSLFRRQGPQPDLVHDLTARGGDVVGSLALQGSPDPHDDWLIALLVQQAGLAVAADRATERLDRIAGQARSAAHEHRLLEQTWRSSFGEAPIGMAITSVDDTTQAAHLQVNDALSRLSGHSNDRLLEMTALDLIHPDDRAPIASAYRRVAGGRRIPFSHAVRYLCADGEQIPVQVTTTPVFDDDGRAVHAVMHVEYRGARPDADAEEQSRLDPSTGLLATAALADELTQTLARAERHETTTAVMLLDLRRLQSPGSDLDAAAADLGTALSGVLRPEDTLARVDDATVAVVLEELSADNAVMVADRFGNRIRALPGLAPGTDPGVGIAMIRPGELAADAALARAGDALRDALTREGSEPVVYATPEPPREPAKVVLWSRDES